MANASIECPILADALPTLNISRTQCCSTDFNDPVSCRNGRLVKVDFQNCAVNGPLSPLLANLTALRYFRLDNCKVTGSIPSWISAWESLYLLSLMKTNLQDLCLPVWNGFAAYSSSTYKGTVYQGRFLPCKTLLS
ncbi:hypothetical protein BC829DRAFT_17629 [Chytridium lagenaria]|nr:hypothetical protein BC829DRAFT_17629 [Chytridium lagenaria]